MTSESRLLLVTFAVLIIGCEPDRFVPNDDDPLPPRKWTVIDISYSPDSLQSIFGVADGTLFAVGRSGTILRFDPILAAWHSEASPVDCDYMDVWARSPKEAYAVGEDGEVVKYDGSTWIRLSTSVSENLHAVWGEQSGQRLVVVGDGGTVIEFDGSVFQAMNSGTSQHLRGVAGPSIDTLIVVGEADSSYHYDGSVWTKKPTGTMQHLWSVAWGGDRAIAVGNSGTALTYDMSTWSVFPPGQIADLYDVSISEGVVYVGGSGGLILKHSGASWTELFSYTAEHSAVKGIWSKKADDVYIVEDGAGIVRNTDTQWSMASIDQNATVRGVWVASSKDVFIVSYKKSIGRYDGNQVSPMMVPFPSRRAFEEDLSLEGGIDGHNPISVYAGGTVQTPSAMHGCVLSFDGTEWSNKIHYEEMFSCIEAVCAAPNGSVFAAGGCIDRGVMVQDGEFVCVYVGRRYDDLWCDRSSTVFGVGIEFDPLGGGEATGAIYQRCSIIPAGELEYLNGIWGWRDTRMWAVGSEGTIMHFDGQSWLRQTSPTTNTLYDIWGASPKDILAVGEKGTVVHFDGSEWQLLPPPTDKTLYCIDGVSASDIFVGGAYGTFLRFGR